MNRLHLIFFIISSFLFSFPVQAQSDLNYVQMDSVKIPYKIMGEGRSVLFIPDGLENPDAFVDYLQGQGNRVILPQVDASLSVEEKAVQMMVVGSTVSRDPIHVIGSADQADLAERMSFLYPANVHRLILVGSEKPMGEVHCPVTFISPAKKKGATMDKVQAELLNEVVFPVKAAKKVLFDLSHNQCKDVYKGYETYPYLVPAYKRMVAELGDVELVVNEDQELTPELLSTVDAVLMTSPLNKGLQKNLLDSERKALINYVSKGRSLVLFIDDAHRVDWEAYGAQDVVAPYGITFGKDVPLPGNVGAVSFQNKVFKERYQIPYSGACLMTGGIPVSVCMNEGYLHGAIVELQNGGKLYIGGDTMVGLLLGFHDGVRLSRNMMATRWWGKDSWDYMKDLLIWALK